MGSGSNKASARVYPWHDLAWDLALANGMDPAQIESRLAANKLEGIEDAINTEISTHLWRDILQGKVPVRKANGNPLNGDPKQFKMRGPDTPHLTVAEGNEWLTKNRHLQVWAPGDFKKPKDVHGAAVEAASCAAKVATPNLLPSIVAVIVPAVKAASDGPGWRLTEPKRYQGYGKPMYDLLKAAHVAVQPRPKPRDVLDAWKKNPQLVVTEVMADGIKYLDANGNTKIADLDAIRATINRMTTT